MILQKVHVENFRILKDFKLDFRDNLSLIVGKNNCGKTSILTIMDMMLNNDNPHFLWNDFNLEWQKNFFEKLSNADISENFTPDGIKMQVFVQYSDNDNYENIQNFMMDLDPLNNIIVLEFFYYCKEDNFEKLKEDLEKENVENSFEKFTKYMEKFCSKYFVLQKYSRGYVVGDGKITDEISSDIKNSEIKKLIKFRSIKANREFSNKMNSHSLSTLSQKYYDSQSSKNEKAVEVLQKAVQDADDIFNAAYNGTEEEQGIFNNVVQSVKKFGEETDISIQSSISDKDFLKNNTTLFYKSEDSRLPENYNGLGYLNLIGMILEIETIISEFHGKENEKPADINILFIEEPEAHTHPQLQYIFIKNIKELIQERTTKNGDKIVMQTVISTHSSHIVSECDFKDIRYLLRKQSNLVSKNFKELENEYGSDKLAFNFVKQYLNLSRSELFFADKAIFIEGDTERILLPAMMRKVDELHKEDGNYIPLLSQNISIVEAGAHAHTFKRLIEFLEIKVLIITDIDMAVKESRVDKKGKEKLILVGCKPSEKPTHTTNASIKEYFKLENTNEQFSILSSKKVCDKIINNCCIAYQTEKNGYQASSFEDAFVCENFEYVYNHKDDFKQGLKNTSKFEDLSKNDIDCYYNLAQECIAKKSAFATEILYYDGANETGGKWSVPEYIKEGLEWL
ncbi:MAG TPA: AAA family ATPase [Lactovum miscens]|uniref:ATP-dependent nuclease n=1 Tax=Lactovum miscens TaxID=190387 RepID=UPI002EDAC49B